MLACLGATRVALSSDATRDVRAESASPDDREVDGLATLAGDHVSVLLWHHADRWRATGSASVDLTIQGLPFDGSSVSMRHWRIDDEHSNAYAEWVRQGRPEDPSAAQLEQIKRRQGLELLEAPATHQCDGGRISLRIELPLHACSLIELTPV